MFCDHEMIRSLRYLNFREGREGGCWKDMGSFFVSEYTKDHRE